MIYVLIYFVLLFIGFYYYNREDYKRFDNPSWIEDIMFILLATPIFLIFCITKYGIFKKKKLENNWLYERWDYIEVNGRKAIYLNNYNSNTYVVFEWDFDSRRVNKDDLSFVYKDVLKEELKLLEEADKLNKKATELYNKVQKKKNIFNS